MHDSLGFPNEFDYEFYKSLWPEAAGMSPREAHNHFRKFGSQYGLPGSPLADMRIFVQFLSKLHFCQILEIGPWATPRMVGENVCYFDVTSREKLQRSAKRMGIDPSSVPEINYQSEDGCLKCIDRKFDMIFSSHCIEHVYDIVRHLNEVADLLEDGGIYALIVPDKRYTFDYFRPTTSLGDIVDHHFRKLDRHTLKTFIDSVYSAHNDPKRHWDNDHGEIVRMDATMLERAMELYRSTGGRGGRHAWIFTEETFREVFTQLASMDLVHLQPIRIYNTIRNSNSFCVVMKKTFNQH